MSDKWKLLLKYPKNGFKFDECEGFLIKGRKFLFRGFLPEDPRYILLTDIESNEDTTLFYDHLFLNKRFTKICFTELDLQFLL